MKTTGILPSVSGEKKAETERQKKEESRKSKHFLYEEGTGIAKESLTGIQTGAVLLWKRSVLHWIELFIDDNAKKIRDSWHCGWRRQPRSTCSS